MAQACRKIASPSSPSRLSEKRIAGPAFFSALCSIAAPDQLDAAQVLRFEPDTIKGVQTGARLTVAAEEPVEAGQTVEAVRDRFAVEHDAGGGEGAHDIRDGDEVTRPVAAQKRSLQHLRE